MADKTTHLGLNVPGGDELPDSTPLAENFETLDREVFRRGKAINGIEVNENGDFIVEEIPFARNLVTDEQQSSSGEYLFRTTGGIASLSDGEATLVGVHGRSIHTGVVTEQLDMTVHSEPRPAPEEGEEQDPGITATLDRATFIAKVENPASITVVLNYTTMWSENPVLYGVTVTGTPISGDSITIAYVRADRGAIAVSNPTAFRSTGWNLFNSEVGYARVKKYSEQYGFMVGGTYTSLQYSETLDGAKSAISVSNGRFTIPGDGYVWVTGGNGINTYIMMTWSDWTDGPVGEWQAYTESVIDLSDIMTQCFPYGLCKVGPIIDEINVGAQVAVQRIGRMAYTAEAEAAMKLAGTEYDADEDYIYYVLAEPVSTAISLTDKYTANDHGMEYVDSTSDVAPFIQTLYGENLVDKLRTDVVTKSSDLVNNGTHTGTGKALDARMGKTLTDDIAAVQDGMAIISDGDIHPSIPARGFVFVKNHSTLATGLYRVTSETTAIGTNAPLSLSNLTLDSTGGLNALKGDLDSLNSKIALQIVPEADVVIDVNSSYKIGNIAYLLVKAHFTAEKTGTVRLFTVSSLPGNTFAQSGVFGINTGGEWDVDGVCYGYISGNAILTKYVAGKYHHVCVAVVC